MNTNAGNISTHYLQTFSDSTVSSVFTSISSQDATPSLTFTTSSGPGSSISQSNAGSTSFQSISATSSVEASGRSTGFSSGSSSGPSSGSGSSSGSANVISSSGSLVSSASSDSSASASASRGISAGSSRPSGSSVSSRPSTSLSAKDTSGSLTTSTIASRTAFTHTSPKSTENSASRLSGSPQLSQTVTATGLVQQGGIRTYLVTETVGGSRVTRVLTSTFGAPSSGPSEATPSPIGGSVQRNSGLSTGGKVAIGVAVPLGVLSILAVGVLAFLWFRRRRVSPSRPRSETSSIENFKESHQRNHSYSAHNAHNMF